MDNFGYLSKENIDVVFKKLSTLFKYGRYSSDNEYLMPQVTIISLSGEDFSAGLRITVPTSPLGSNTIHIPYGALFSSSEDDDFSWEKFDYDNSVGEVNLPELPGFSFSWFVSNNNVRLDLDIDNFTISYTAHDMTTGFKLFDITIV